MSIENNPKYVEKPTTDSDGKVEESKVEPKYLCQIDNEPNKILLTEEESKLVTEEMLDSNHYKVLALTLIEKFNLFTSFTLFTTESP